MEVAEYPPACNGTTLSGLAEHVNTSLGSEPTLVPLAALSHAASIARPSSISPD
jgi:hypothetical protein